MRFSCIFFQKKQLFKIQIYLYIKNKHFLNSKLINYGKEK